eukprot:gb/GECH01013548.1/.p1 GENE.gb/GECH01013548.1/~~gb/GECH01013548.1/.p1  ORF type:complete len:320 (+),score=26.49 gb/GECH01013548.1/:1-960(+)
MKLTISVAVITACICALALFILLVSLIGDSLAYVNYDEYGIDYNRYSKKINRDKIYPPGRHLTGVGHSFYIFPSVYQTVDFSNTLDTSSTPDSVRTYGPLQCRTFDGLSLTLEVSFQYIVRKEQVFDIFFTYGTSYPPVITRIGRDAIRDVASQYNASRFFDDRRSIAFAMQQRLTDELQAIPVDMGPLQLREIILPSAYEDVIERKEIVRQQIEQAFFERRAQEVRARTQVLVAEEDAQVRIIGAEADADARVTQSEADAAGTRIRVAAESGAYASLAERLGMTPEQLLSYLWVKAVSGHSAESLLVHLERPAILEKT